LTTGRSLSHNNYGQSFIYAPISPLWPSGKLLTPVCLCHQVV